MKLYIEGLTVLAILFMVAIWFAWYKWSERRLLKKYKPENDKGRKGTEFRKAERGIKKPVINNVGHEQPERRDILQETDVSNDGEDIDSSRKVGFFRR